MFEKLHQEIIKRSSKDHLLIEKINSLKNNNKIKIVNMEIYESPLIILVYHIQESITVINENYKKF